MRCVRLRKIANYLTKLIDTVFCLRIVDILCNIYKYSIHHTMNFCMIYNITHIDTVYIYEALTNFAD